jgi:hypothetical protein
MWLFSSAYRDTAFSYHYLSELNSRLIFFCPPISINVKHLITFRQYRDEYASSNLKTFRKADIYIEKKYMNLLKYKCVKLK